ncbi:hypothetical protein ES319_A01G231400v1, partial [Gossypium barbadense]
NFWGNDTKKIYFFTPEKWFSDELYTDWSFINELKRRNLSKEFIKRVESLDKESFDLGILEKRTDSLIMKLNENTFLNYMILSCIDPTAEESKNGVPL